MARRRHIGLGLGVLALGLFGVAFAFFVAIVGSSLGEEPVRRATDVSIAAGFLLSGVGGLAALIGAISVLASARARATGDPQSGGSSWAAHIAVRAVGLLVALWLGANAIAWNVSAAGGEEPLGSLVFVCSLLGFLTIFAGGLASFGARQPRRALAAVAITALGLFAVATILANLFGGGT